MENVIVVLIIVGIVAGALFYIIKEKKKGTKCIGCPSGKTCPRCNCHSTNK